MDLTRPNQPSNGHLVAAVLALVVLGMLLVNSGADTPAARRFGRPPSGYLLRQGLRHSLSECFSDLLLLRL